MARPKTEREKLTPLQDVVLMVVQENGPVTVSEVLYHWPISEGSARSALRTLEGRGLIGRDYTSRDYYPSRFGYVG